MDFQFLPFQPMFPLRFKAMTMWTKVGILATLLMSAVPCYAAFGWKLDGTLDKPAISYSYFEGDFYRILPPLEAWRASRATKNREDSIFVYKYLSVIYAADSSTRNKAESYMVQLLKLMPTIELVDMYISDNIESIFKNVQEKYLKQQQYVRHHDDLGRSIQDSTNAKENKEPRVAKEKSSHTSAWLWWTVGGVGVAAAVAGGYYAFHSESPSESSVKSFQP